jgi:hypothetical protein
MNKQYIEVERKSGGRVMVNLNQITYVSTYETGGETVTQLHLLSTGGENRTTISTMEPYEDFITRAGISGIPIGYVKPKAAFVV